MRSTTSFLLYATFLIFSSTFTTAWPWQNILPDIGSLVVRQDSDPSITTDGPSKPTEPPSSKGSSKETEESSDDDSKDTKESSNDDSSKETEESSSDDSSKETETPSSSQTRKPTSGHEQSTTGTKSTPTSSENSTSVYSKPIHTSYDPRLPAGGITMLSPVSTSGLPVFKIGDVVTFGYNFTSLSATPTALNVMATCSENRAMYTIAMNQTINATATTKEALWDTDGYETRSAPLVSATYTLIMYDSEGSQSDAPEAGYLAPFTTFAFGLYTRQHYEDDDGPIKCITCSGAFSSLERNALRFVFGMGIITVLTFTWFVNGLDIIW